MNVSKKQKSYNFGILAEKIVGIFLTLKFYKIIHRRFKCKFGEIDIIARKNNRIIFIEVKARKDIALMDFISKYQSERIKKAAEFFILQNPKYRNYKISFDAIYVNKYFIPIQIKNYW